MAYNWDWNHKSGEFTFNGNTYNFYEGNGFMIIISEFTMSKEMARERRSIDDTAEEGKECYQVMWFFIDDKHAKRCLGLEKGSYDMFEGNVEKIKIFKDECTNWKKIVDLFTKTQPNIVIEIHPTNPNKEVAE